MKAHLQSVRIAPKKANLIARMVRGLTVPDAIEELRLTNKKGARLIETLLRSAVANASHNDKQDPQTMVIKTIVVNQGQAYRRGMPKARGQQRPYRKFLSHITVTLGFPGDIDTPVAKNSPKPKSAGKASQTSEVPVKKASVSKKQKTPSAKKTSSDSSESSVSSAS